MALSPGTRLGPYEILSALGAGGMGEVYKARDGRLDRTVAIKILPEALAGDAQFRDRFDREARAVSHLDHPHICALGKELQAGIPHPLFPTQLAKGSDRHTYAVTKDGKRFLVRVPDQRQVSVPITVVLNWPVMAKQ